MSAPLTLGCDVGRPILERWKAHEERHTVGMGNILHCANEFHRHASKDNCTDCQRVWIAIQAIAVENARRKLW